MTPALLAAALSLAAGPATLRLVAPRHAAELGQRWSAPLRDGNPAASFSVDKAPLEAVRSGAADVALTDQRPDDDQARALATIPVAVTAVAVAYNVLLAGDLRLSKETLAAIFAGRIARWNDPAIAADNPGVLLPALALRVLRQRPDAAASRTLAEFLASPADAANPAALGSDEAVADALAATEGAIGYVDAASARRRGLYLASVKNAAGLFVQPAAHSVSRAAVGVRMPADFRASLAGASGADSYPIAAFTYAVARKADADPARAAAVRSLLGWALHDGQAVLAPLGYARLPAFLVLSIDSRLQSLGAQ